jgi:nitronate monooxygenase
MQTDFSRALGIEVPLICGAMYPCSNPELVAAVSEAGGIGIVQPLSLTYVHGYEFREGLRYIRSLTSKPIGVNLIIEQSSKKYLVRVHRWLEIALEENVPLLVTALGNPRWVVDQARSTGTIIYHDVTNGHWARKALDGGVDGFICVNNRAGGHAGELSAQELLAETAPLGKPLICAGGVATPEEFGTILKSGYVGAQLGTRFLASKECHISPEYKTAILRANESDIVLTEKISGVPVSIIRTPYIDRIGTRAGPLAKWMLEGRKTRHWMRTIYSLQAIWKLKQASLQGSAHKDYWQAGKSVAGINEIQPVANIVADFASIIDE